MSRMYCNVLVDCSLVLAYDIYCRECQNSLVSCILKQQICCKTLLVQTYGTLLTIVTGKRSCGFLTLEATFWVTVLKVFIS